MTKQKLEEWMISPPNKDKIALDQLVSYYMHERKLIGRNVRNAVYESAEKMVAIWRIYVVDAFTPDMGYTTIINIQKTRSQVIKNILSFIDKDMPRASTTREADLQAEVDRLRDALEVYASETMWIECEGGKRTTVSWINSSGGESSFGKLTHLWRGHVGELHPNEAAKQALNQESKP